MPVLSPLRRLKRPGSKTCDDGAHPHFIELKLRGGDGYAGRDSRDAFLGLMKSCAKQSVGFWDYLGDRLGVPDAPAVPSLAELIRAPASA
jgi:hypothetical protein